MPHSLMSHSRLPSPPSTASLAGSQHTLLPNNALFDSISLFDLQPPADNGWCHSFETYPLSGFVAAQTPLSSRLSDDTSLSDFSSAPYSARNTQLDSVIGTSFSYVSTPRVSASPEERPYRRPSDTSLIPSTHIPLAAMKVKKLRRDIEFKLDDIESSDIASMVPLLNGYMSFIGDKRPRRKNNKFMNFRRMLGKVVSGPSTTAAQISMNASAIWTDMTEEEQTVWNDERQVEPADDSSSKSKYCPRKKAQIEQLNKGMDIFHALQKMEKAATKRLGVDAVLRQKSVTYVMLLFVKLMIQKYGAPRLGKPRSNTKKPSPPSAPVKEGLFSSTVPGIVVTSPGETTESPVEQPSTRACYETSNRDLQQFLDELTASTLQDSTFTDLFGSGRVGEATGAEVSLSTDAVAGWSPCDVQHSNMNQVSVDDHYDIMNMPPLDVNLEPRFPVIFRASASSSLLLPSSSEPFTSAPPTKRQRFSAASISDESPEWAQNDEQVTQSVGEPSEFVHGFVAPAEGYKEQQVDTTRKRTREEEW